MSETVKLNGLQPLSKSAIKNLVREILVRYEADYFQRLRRFQVENFLQFIKIDKKISVYTEEFPTYNIRGKRMLGCYFSKSSKIYIDNALFSDGNAYKKLFVLAHEIGHAYLHQDVLSTSGHNGILEDTDQEVHYYLNGKRVFKNDFDFLEWQANYFASVLLVPDEMIYTALIKERSKIGLCGPPFLYVDKQRATRKDNHHLILSLSKIFGVSKSLVWNRLEDLGLIVDQWATSDGYPKHVSIHLMRFFKDKIGSSEASGDIISWHQYNALSAILGKVIKHAIFSR